MKNFRRSERIECAILAGWTVGALAGSGSLVWWSVFVFLPFLFLFFRKLALWCAVAAVIAGFASSYLRLNDLQRVSNAISEKDYAYGKFKLRLCDPRQTSLGYIDHPTMITSQLLEYSIYPDENKTADKPLVMVKLPAGFPAQLYGSVITGSGTISNSRDRSFANYLISRDIVKTIYLNKCEVLQRERGIWGAIIDFRDLVAGRVLSKIENENSRNLASALFFGITGGMSRERRSVFVNTGTIHVFSVSGMHVAVLAFFLFLIFRPAGMRTGYIITVILTGIYVVSTGASAPAVRAFAMLFIWAAMRIFLYWMAPFSVFCWASFFLLAGSPLLALDVGARYSVVITGVLVAVSEKLKYLNCKKLIMQKLYVPGGRKPERTFWKRNLDKVFPAVIICISAFLGGLAISMHHQGQFLPASVPLNLVLMPFMSVFYLLLGVVLVWPGAGILLSGAFSILHGVCEIVAGISTNIQAVSPPAFEMWLYIFSLFVVLRFRGTVRLGAAILLVSLVLRWLILPLTANLQVVVCGTGSDSPPMVAFIDSREDSAVIIDPSKSSSSAYIDNYLKQCGVTKIETVMFSRNSVKNMRGLRTLIRRNSVSRTVVPEPAKYERIKYFRTALADCGVKNLIEYGKSSEKVKIIRQKSAIRLEYFNRSAKLKTVLILEKNSSGYLVNAEYKNRVTDPLLLASDGVERIHRYEFAK